MGSRSWLRLLPWLPLGLLAVVLCRVRERSWPWLCEPCGSIPSSSDIHGLSPRPHPAAVASLVSPQRHGAFLLPGFPAAFYMCGGGRGEGAGCPSAIVGWPKLPWQGEAPGLGLCVRAAVQGGLAEALAGTVCSSPEQTAGSLSALPTELGLTALAREGWRRAGGLGWGGVWVWEWLHPWVLPAESWRWVVFTGRREPGPQPSGCAWHFLEFLGAEGPLVNKPTELGSQRCKLCHEEKSNNPNLPP